MLNKRLVTENITITYDYTYLVKLTQISDQFIITLGMCHICHKHHGEIDIERHTLRHSCDALL